MVKHIRKREYIPIYFALVLVALLFLWKACVEEWARVCLGSCCMWLSGLHGARIQTSGAWFSWF